MKNLLKHIISWLIKPFLKLKRRWIIARAYPKMLQAYKDQKQERFKLKKEIMAFLRNYFGIDANSKYIPKDFKSKEEVKMAVCDKYQKHMDSLNLKYSDLFA